MIKDKLFYIGVLIFSLTLLFEHILQIESNTTCFIKGFGAGLQLVGIVILFLNKKKYKQSE